MSENTKESMTKIKSNQLFHSLVSENKVFVDWSIKQPHHILINNSRKIIRAKLPDLDIINSNVYLERGCPRAELYFLIKNNNRVFQIDGKEVKEFREKVKSDENDVKTIRKLATGNPELFIELEEKDKNEIKNIAIYNYYRKITKVCASLKNQQKAFYKDFGKNNEEITKWIKQLESEKRKLMKENFNEFEVPDFRGLGKRIFTGIMIMANPKKFHSLSAYLRYCGLKGSCKIDKKYNRYARTLYHQFADGCVKSQNKNYYLLYLKLKKDIKLRFLEFPKYRINNMAMNRLSTFLAKSIYQEYHTDGVSKLTKVYHPSLLHQIPLGVRNE